MIFKAPIEFKVKSIDECIDDMNNIEFNDDIILSESNRLLNMSIQLFNDYGDVEFISEGVKDFIQVAIDKIKAIYNKFITKVKEAIASMIYRMTTKDKSISILAKNIEKYDATINVPYRPYASIDVFKTYPDMRNLSTISMMYVDKIASLKNINSEVDSWANGVLPHINDTALLIYRGRTLGKTYNISKDDYDRECHNVFINPAYVNVSEHKRITIDKSNISGIAKKYIEFPELLKSTRKEFSTMDILLKKYIKEIEKNSAFKAISTSATGAYYTIYDNIYSLDNGKKIFDILKLVIVDLTAKLDIVTTCYKTKISTMSADIKQSAHIINAYYEARK